MIKVDDCVQGILPGSSEQVKEVGGKDEKLLGEMPVDDPNRTDSQRPCCRGTGADTIPEVVLRAFAVASLLAQGDVPAAVEPLRTLRERVLEQPEDFTTGWTFDGTLHFVRHTPDLPNREVLTALFQALDAPHRDAIVEGIEAIVEELEPAPERSE